MDHGKQILMSKGMPVYQELLNEGNLVRLDQPFTGFQYFKYIEILYSGRKRW